MSFEQDSCNDYKTHKTKRRLMMAMKTRIPKKKGRTSPLKG
jgi:hypothetical protein